MSQPEEHAGPDADSWILEFLRHLATNKDASVYTQRNYRQALLEFFAWSKTQRGAIPDWPALRRDDFRDYLRFLGRGSLSRAAIQLRFSALRSFYKFLIRNGVAAVSPIKNLSLPQPQKRLPLFLTVKQLQDLLEAPGVELRRAAEKGEVDASLYFRDAAILEVIYSCGLRVSELCRLCAADIDWPEQVVRVRGKGKKERLVPIGAPALEAIRAYWKHRTDPVVVMRRRKSDDLVRRAAQGNAVAPDGSARLDHERQASRYRRTAVAETSEGY